MTFPEVLYFTVTTDLAFFSARWVYFRWGWIAALLCFACIWSPFIWLFFSGRFSRLTNFFAGPGKQKKKSD
jgi:hypothetical protein